MGKYWVKIVDVIRIPIQIIRELRLLLIMYLPGPMGFNVRRRYYSRVFKKCGKNLAIDIGVSISGAKLISVGDNVYIDKYCIISTSQKLKGEISRKSNDHFDHPEGEIVIGDNIHIVQFCILTGCGGLQIENNCVLSAGCKIYSLTNTAYDLNDKSKVTSLLPYNQANFLVAPIVLKSNVWLGLNTIVMPGVTIESDSFSVANSLIMNSFPPNSYLAGQPAKKIRNRFVNK